MSTLWSPDLRRVGRHRRARQGLRVMVTTASVALAVSLGVVAGSWPAAAATPPGAAQVVTGTVQINAVACPTDSDCLAVGQNGLLTDGGDLVPIIDGTAGTAEPVSATYHLDGIACATGGACVAVGADDTSSYAAVVPIGSGGTPGTRQVVEGPESLYGVACPDSTTCYAVGTGSGEGWVVTITNGIAGAPQTVPGAAELAAIACSTADDCEAAGVSSSDGSQGVLIPIVDGAPTAAVQQVPGASALSGVACPSADVCEAVGIDPSGTHGVVVTVTDGVVGAPEAMPGGDSVSGVACSGPTSCVGVGQGLFGTGVNAIYEAALFPIIGGSPGIPQGVPNADLLFGGAYSPSMASFTAVGDNSSAYLYGLVAAFDVPGPVVGPGANRGNGQATVAFGPPATDGGTPVTGYTVTADDTTTPSNGGEVAQGTGSPITVSGLTNGDSYTFAVAATNAIGSGPATATPPITPATVPGAPTAVSATAGNASAVVSFTPPASDGGNPIGGYQVQATDVTDASRGGQLAHGAGSPISISDLTNGDSYTFTVAAGNQVGVGPASAPSSQVVPTTVPDPPTSVSAVAGNESAVVSFTPPASDGGSPITAYTVTAHDQTTAGDGGQAATGTGSPISVEGLTNGDSYTFAVVATNAAGNSSPSPLSAPIVPAGVPTTTTLSSDPDPSTPGQQVTLTATVSPAAATGVLRMTDANGSPLLGCGLIEVTDGTASCSYTFPAAGTVEITATYYGNDTYSGSSDSLAQQVSAAPGAPIGVSAAARNGSAVVSFTPPAGDGGSPITGYTATATDLTTPANGGQSATGTTSPITIGGLTNGDVYTFTVTASNAVGTGAASAAAPPVTPTAGTPITTVTVHLTDSAGVPLGGGVASYYANGWHSIGTTGAEGTVYAQLLPGSYSFAVTYRGTRQQLNHQAVTGDSSSVAFATSDVAVHLASSAGVPLGGGVASYYANGWHSIGTTGAEGTVYAQLLPGSYSFAVTYRGTRQQLNHQAVTGDSSSVAFITGQVHSNSGTAAAYYAGAWRPFTQDMQLLAGTYTFSFTDGTPNTRITLSGDTVNTIH